MISKKIKAGGIFLAGASLLMTGLAINPNKVSADSEMCKYKYRYYFAETEAVGVINGEHDDELVNFGGDDVYWDYTSNDWVNPNGDYENGRLYDDNATKFSTIFNEGKLPTGYTNLVMNMYGNLEDQSTNYTVGGGTVDLTVGEYTDEFIDDWFDLIAANESYLTDEEDSEGYITRHFYHGTWANLQTGYIESEVSDCSSPDEDGYVTCVKNDMVTFGKLIRYLYNNDRTKFEEFKEDFKNAMVPMKGLKIDGLESAGGTLSDDVEFNITRTYGISKSSPYDKTTLTKNALDGQKWLYEIEEMDPSLAQELRDTSFDEISYKWIYMPSMLEYVFEAPCSSVSDDDTPVTPSDDTEEPEETSPSTGIPSYGYLAIILAGAAGVYVIAKKRNKFVKF